MLYGRVRNIDKDISRIVYGTASPVFFNAFRSVYENAPDFQERLDNAFEKLDTMYSLGINCFDCADHYGEEPLGEWLESRGVRDNVVILAKGAHHNRWRKRITDFDILHDIHNTLAKLKTDHVEMYLLHRDDPTVPVGPIIEVMNRLLDEGKVLTIGASNWSIERFEEANEYAYKHGLTPFTVASPNFSLANQVDDPWGGGCYALSASPAARDHKYYAENNIPIFAYSPLARGLFSGRIKGDDPEAAYTLLDAAGVKGYCSKENFERLRRAEKMANDKGVPVAQIAMAWIYNQKDLTIFPLSGSNRIENMKYNIEAMTYPLTEAECRWLNLECD